MKKVAEGIVEQQGEEGEEPSAPLTQHLCHFICPVPCIQPAPSPPPRSSANSGHFASNERTELIKSQYWRND